MSSVPDKPLNEWTSADFFAYLHPLSGSSVRDDATFWLRVGVLCGYASRLEDLLETARVGLRDIFNDVSRRP